MRNSFIHLVAAYDFKAEFKPVLKMWIRVQGKASRRLKTESATHSGGWVSQLWRGNTALGI
jgi:hypothetical protein